MPFSLYTAKNRNTIGYKQYSTHSLCSNPIHISSLFSMTSSASINNNNSSADNTSSNHPSNDIHIKSRISPYANSDQSRFPLSDDQVRWSTEYAKYSPPFFTIPGVINNNLSDPSFAHLSEKSCALKWNSLDGKLDRRSHIGIYAIDAEHNVPINPIGRTGLRGRGWLWRWGPNHAADPIVTRWLRDINDESVIVTHEMTKKPILQFVAIERTDGGGWAIPGGMVDPGENISRTLKREFGEESLNSLVADEQEKQRMQTLIDEVFAKGVEIYKGYADDPRNTGLFYLLLCVE